MARVIAVLTILLATFASAKFGDMPKSTQEDAADVEKRKQALAKMRSFLTDVEVYDVEDGVRRRVPLVDHAVLLCQDVEAGYHEGSLWVWGEKGRPRAIFEGYWKSPANLREWP